MFSDAFPDSSLERNPLGDTDIDIHQAWKSTVFKIHIPFRAQLGEDKYIHTLIHTLHRLKSSQGKFDISIWKGQKALGLCYRKCASLPLQ